MFRRSCTLFCAILLLALPCPALAGFDVYQHQIKGLRVGMTVAEAAATLRKADGVALVARYTPHDAKAYGTSMLQMPTLECTILDFRLREMTAPGKYPLTILNLTAPMPGEPQRIWAITRVDRFAADAISLSTMRDRLIASYGAPDDEVISTRHAGRDLFYGNKAGLPPQFDNAAPAIAARGQRGLWISLIGPRTNAHWTEIKLQIGDYALWLDSEDRAQRYRTRLLDEQDRCQNPKPAPSALKREFDY